MSITIYGGKDEKSVYNLLITGSRDWCHPDMVFKAIEAVASWAEEQELELHIIHGGARGADSHADQAAEDLELPCHRYPAPWKRMKRQVGWKGSRSAGPQRNRVMINRHEIHACISFHEDLKNSKGTKDMVNLVRKSDIEYEHIGG